MRKRPEQALQILVADYLRAQYPQLLWFHPNNNIPMRGKERLGGIMKRMGVRAGVADIIMTWKQEVFLPVTGGSMRIPVTKTAAIELKAGKNGLEDTQKLFQQHWLYTGGQYAVCRSLDEVIECLKEWGVPGIKHCPPMVAEGALMDRRCKPSKEPARMLEEVGK